jgi:hypothetical protein
VAQMLGDMAANAYAVDSMAELSSSLADQARNDIRLEAAIAKLWTTEVGWKMVDDCLQIRGGRGYETADSLRDRGEVPIPVERMMRDFRINRIFEGSSEIMRLFIAREAVDTHLQVAGDILKTDLSPAQKAKAFGKAGAHYAVWYPQRWVGWGRWPRFGEFGRLATHLRYCERTSRRLARTLFHAMARFGPKLEKKQAVLGRLVDIGAELYAMAAVCVRAQSESGEEKKKAQRLADVFCRRARRRIEVLFDQVFRNDDNATYKLAQEVLRGEHAWLERGILQVVPDDAGSLVKKSEHGSEAPQPRKEPTPTEVGAGG